MEQFSSSARAPSFWRFQLGGWLLYALAIAASMAPMRAMRGEAAYRSASLIAGFLCSFPLYWLCHGLWKARVPLLRALFVCSAAAYVLGVLDAAAGVWAEQRYGGEAETFHISYLLAWAIGTCFVLMAWSFLYFGIKHYYALEEERIRLQAAEVMARDAQMRALRYQLQPHFLFNTLNAISTLVLDNQPRLATQMIARLADLLRRTLESPDTHQVSLKEEIAVTKEYLALEEVRFGSRLRVAYHIAADTHEAQVPRFLLQPLVENAIRHGIARRPQGGSLVLRSEASGGRLRVTIQNDQAEDGSAGLRLSPGTRRRGVGLANTRARLEQMYGHEATMESRATSQGIYEVHLTMPFSAAPRENEPVLETVEAE